MSEKIGKILKGQIVSSLIYIVLGGCMVCMPVGTVDVICKFVFGILLILAGLYHIITYIVEKLSATVFDLLSGGVLLVLGAFLFQNPQVVIKLLPTLLGTFVLVDSIWSLKGSLRLKKKGSGAWKILFFGSLIFIGLGIALIVNPFEMVKYTVIFAGCIFLGNGVVDLAFLILLRKGLKELKQELTAVDAEGRVIGDDEPPAPFEEPEQDPNVNLQPENGMPPQPEDFKEPEAPQEPAQPEEPQYAEWNSRNKTEE